MRADFIVIATAKQGQLSKDINDAELDHGVNLLFPVVPGLFSNFQVLIITASFS